jgi:ribulose-5-phosphate 4-epimerase/fuculose-1-phosphate aldolase
MGAHPFLFPSPHSVHFSHLTTDPQTRPANAAGFLIHSEIHKARPDVHAVCHAHTIAGRAWSAFARPLDMLNQDICYFYDALAVYGSYGGIVFAAEEGRNIARALGRKNKVRETSVFNFVPCCLLILIDG